MPPSVAITWGSQYMRTKSSRSATRTRVSSSRGVRRSSRVLIDNLPVPTIDNDQTGSRLPLTFTIQSVDFGGQSQQEGYMDLQEALSQISEIRQQVARSETFRGYRAAPVAFSGVVACL